MDSDSSDVYFSWLSVTNTVEDHLKDGSLIHTFSCANKIRESTKKLNKHLKTSHPRSYSDFVKCKKDVLSKLTNNLDVSDDSELSDTDFKTFYSSFNNSNAGTSKEVHDELFVWSFVEKKGLKVVKPEDAGDNSIWESTIDISIADGNSQAEGQAKFNGSFEAARALPIIKTNFSRKKSTEKIHYNTRQSSSNNSIDNNTNLIQTPEKHEEEEVEKIKTPATKERNTKLNGVKRNLKSAIKNVSSQMSETVEADFTCDFIPEDFQAQSTQIFSDTFTNNSIRLSNQNNQVHKFSSNNANHQPRDSGIDEDSRDENTPHQNIENNERKALGALKTEEQNSLSSENIESLGGSKKKQPLKIIGDETLTKKYKIIAQNNKGLQPIVEETNVTSSELNNKSNDYSNHEVNNDSEDDFKSIESEDEEELNVKEKVKESSDEYHDIPDNNNALSSENEKVSESEENVAVKNGRESSVESGSIQHRKRMKKESVRSISPWVAKQYKDLERLRLLESGTDDSEIDVNKTDESNNITEQKVSKENKKTPKKLTNKTEKLSEIHIKSKKENSFINGKLIRNLDFEMNNQQITNENSDEDENVEAQSMRNNESLSSKTERFIKNDNSSNSKLNSDNRDSSESDTASSHRSLQKIKKLKQKKKRSKTNRFDLSSSREQSYERQTQHGLTDIIKSHKNENSSQSIKVETIAEIHQNCEKENALLDLPVETSKKRKTKSVNNNSNDSKENIDATCSRNNRSRNNSNASSIKDLSTSKKENRLKNKTLTTFDDEKESEDEKTMSEHQMKKLQSLKKTNRMASDESSVSETYFENVDLHNKNESTVKNEQIIEKSHKFNDEKIDNWQTTEPTLFHKENASDESDKEDDILPTQQAQKKIQLMKRLNFDDSSESERCDTISINKHRLQTIKSDALKEQNNEKLKKNCKLSSEDESDKEDKIPVEEKKHLQQIQKMDFKVTDESEDSDDHQFSKNTNRKISDEKIKSNGANEKTLNETSDRTHRLSDEEESNQEDTVLENKVKHVKKKKKMNPILTNDSEDTDEEDQTIKSRSRKLSNEKINSEDSEDKDKTSEKKVELQKKSIADSHKVTDSDSVHCDSDNVDIKEHKIILPEELKHSNLLDHLNENNIESFNMSLNNDKSEKYLSKKGVDGSENDSDEEIDNIVPVEVTKRIEQLKRLNLYEDSDSSDSDESLRKNRIDKNISQNISSVSRKQYDDSSSDEKEKINEEQPISTDKLNESELNDTKDSFQDEVVDEKENGGKNMNVIISETQESEEFVSNGIQSQEMFLSFENLTKCASPIPATPKSISKKATPTKLERVKITEIAKLVEQEGLTKSLLESTITLGDISSDDEDIFLIEVPKNVFNQNIVGKKLVVSNDTLTIGESNYEAFQKGSSPVMSCVMKSKKKKFKTVNIRPMFSIIARRKKSADDFNGNTEIEKRHGKKITNQRLTKESNKKSVDAACETESTPTKKSNLKKLKLSHKDKLHSLSSTTLRNGAITKKKISKNKKIKLHNVIDNIESLHEKIEQEIISPSKALKRKLYVSDHELKDVDSNATDESSMNANNSLKKSKKKKKSEKLNIKNEMASTSNNENKDEVQVAVQSKSKTKNKKKTKNKIEESNPQTAEENALEQIMKSREDNIKMFENMFQDSFLLNMSAVEEVQPVKKKARKRKIENNINEDVNLVEKRKKRKKSDAEEAEENAEAAVKPKKSRKKAEKPKEEPPSVQIMKIINSAFNVRDIKHNTSTSSNESRYGALDIERTSAKKNYSSSSSSDETEKKYSKSLFHVREKSKEKVTSKVKTSLNNTFLKKEVKDEKKKVKKVYFDE